MAFLKRLYKFPCGRNGCPAKASVELVEAVENVEDKNLGYYCEPCGKKVLRKSLQLDKLAISINKRG